MLKYSEKMGLVLLFITALVFFESCTKTVRIFHHNKEALSKIKDLNKNQDKFSFVVMGDNRDGDKILKKIIKKINGDKDIAFSFDNGDLVPLGFESEFEDYLKNIAPLKTPLIGIIGNHEHPFFDGETNFNKYIGKSYFSFVFSNDYFIIVDDSENDMVNDIQKKWLIQELQKSQKFTHRFVLMHIPLYDPRKGDYKKGHSLKKGIAKELNDIFDKYNVTMLFTSHIHSFFKGKWHKTPFFISGGAGAPLYGKDPNHSFYHYIKVTVSKDSVDYKIERLL